MRARIGLTLFVAFGVAGLAGQYDASADKISPFERLAEALSSPANCPEARVNQAAVRRYAKANKIDIVSPKQKKLLAARIVYHEKAMKRFTTQIICATALVDFGPHGRIAKGLLRGKLKPIVNF